MIVQYRVQQNQFLVILVHLRCFVVICLTSFFVFNTVLCFLVCSLSIYLYAEEASLTVLVFLVLYIFVYFLCIQYMSPASGASPPDPYRGSAGDFRPQTRFVPLANFWLRPWAAAAVTNVVFPRLLRLTEVFFVQDLYTCYAIITAA